MTSTDRLLEIADALEEIGVRFLILGGHAVRYYGLERNTADFDFLRQLCCCAFLRIPTWWIAPCALPQIRLP